MKIKTFVASTADELDNKVNSFEEGHIVNYTQTHVNHTPDGLYFTAIVFYSGSKNKMTDKLKSFNK